MARASDLRDAAPGAIGGGDAWTCCGTESARRTWSLEPRSACPRCCRSRRSACFGGRSPPASSPWARGPTSSSASCRVPGRSVRFWLATYDLVSRRRVVLGRPGEPYVALSAAVRASCAIPGVYAPVRAADGVLVDGGAWSLVNLDLASLAGCDTVVCVAPMSYDPDRPPDPRDRMVREVSTRALVRGDGPPPPSGHPSRDAVAGATGGGRAGRQPHALHRSRPGRRGGPRRNRGSPPIAQTPRQPRRRRRLRLGYERPSGSVPSTTLGTWPRRGAPRATTSSFVPCPVALASGAAVPEHGIVCRRPPREIGTRDRSAPRRSAASPAEQRSPPTAAFRRDLRRRSTGRACQAGAGRSLS